MFLSLILSSQIWFDFTPKRRKPYSVTANEHSNHQMSRFKMSRLPPVKKTIYHPFFYTSSHWLVVTPWPETNQPASKKTGIFYHSAWEQKAWSRWLSSSHRIWKIKEALSCLENCKNWVKEKCVCLCVFDMKCTWTPWLYLSALQKRRVAARYWRPLSQGSVCQLPHLLHREWKQNAGYPSH